MIARCSLFLLLSLGTLTAAEENAVQLLIPSRTLEPKSTFEVRFPSEMVAADQIGKPAVVSPLVFQPNVAGRFVWLSTRSGSFAPEGTLPLGTKFQITILKGLKDARGSEVGAKFRESAETPPLRVKGADQLSAREPENASVLPSFLVLFNANVKAAAAAPFIHFEDAAHHRVAARVEQAGDPNDRERSFPKYVSDDHSLDAWSAEATPAETDGSESDNDESDDTALEPKKSGPTRGNILFVLPVKPLPPGRDWHLAIEKGIPAAEWKTTLPLTQDFPVGTVRPFAVKSVSAVANRVDGRRILIEFSKSLAEEINAETIGRWLKVQPAPAHLRAAVEERNVTLRGDFALGTRYRVSVASGLPAREPTQTTAPFTQEVSFEKYDSRLYFQDFAADQYAHGSCQLRLVSVNVPRLRISARLFSGEEIPAARKAYDKYQEQPEDSPDEFYS
ncbi:MAG: hypothetical protein M3Y86_12060, partial [Verrucomicrobiota bacterium]|nr:hypothetical protein [Verrucomicrobiota bacterium]